MQLHKLVADAGVRLIVHESIDSTNAAALRLAREGARESTWIVAREQTAGRGRRGRQWHSPQGNLYATLLLIGPCPPERASQLSLVAGVALHDAIVDLAPQVAGQLTLKWPNDLIIGTAKVAGILVEGEGSGGNFSAAIGIGVNCRAHPDRLDYPTTDLATASALVPAEEVFDGLSRAMAERLAQWNGGEGFDSVRAAWLARAPNPGRPIRVRTAEAHIDGTFAGLGARGELLLQLQSGAVRAITSAEVSHPGASPDLA
jgi:BirA family biotin operon repressor/biotin-[acetyl-CoA-carboxylase] ligase